MVATGAQPGKPNDSLSAPQPEGSEWVSLIIRATGAATYEFDAGSKSRIWSPELYDIAGLPQTINVDGDMFLQLVHDDDRGDVVQAAQHATNPEDPQAYDLEYRIVRADGAVRWVRDVSRIAPGQPGQPPRIIGVVRDIDAQKRAEQAQRVSQERFSSVLLMSADWYWEQDENLRFTDFSESVRNLAGSSARSHLGKTRWELPTIGVSEEQWSEHRAALERREPFRNFEFRRVNEDGQNIWVSVSGDPIFDTAGRFRGYRGTGRNITEQKTWDDTQRLLVSELNHRVKNTLATVQAIASNTLSRTRDPASFVETFSGRIQSLATAHTLLTRASWQGADLQELIAEQLALRDTPLDNRISISGPRVHLEPQIALPMALVIHELSTNARRHGSLSGPQGHVTINWDVTDDHGAQNLTLSWRETGGPAVQLPKSRSFGSVLIERSLTFALGGKAKLDFEPQGLAFTVSLPLVSQAENPLATYSQ